MTHPATVPTPIATDDAFAALPPGPLTEAGRIVEQYLAQQRVLVSEARPAAAAVRKAAPAPFRSPSAGSVRPRPSAPAKPSKSRVRAAHQQADLGIRLARQGQYTQAITAFRRSVELDPTVAEVQHNLGLVCLEVGLLEAAASAFGSAVRLKPDLASAQHYLAIAFDQLGRGSDALGAYEATVKLEPQRQEAQFRFGQLCLGRHRWADAETAFRAAAAINANTTIARVSEAYAGYAAGDAVAAQTLLRRVIADEPGCGMAHLVLGELLAQVGQSEEAAACIEHGISLDPQLIAAWHSFASNTKFTAADQALIERIRACLDRPDLTVSQRRAIHSALGKAYDDTGNYAEAIRHFDAANRIRSVTASLDRVMLARETDSMISATPPGYLDRCPDLEDETPILIVGMPRSGTTLVEQILSSHPRVAPGGELRFWGEKHSAGVGIFGASTKPEVVCRLAGDYLAVLRAISPDATRVTDKMPFNFELLGIIRQVFPRATIVHCRRHPIDTCLSIFSTISEATFDFAGDRGNLVFYYRQYQRLMAHWREVLPPDRFIEIDYEKLVADPEPLTRQLIATCGLEWDDACLAAHRNQRRILTPSSWQVRQPIYRTSVERWKRYEQWLGELRQLLPATEDGGEAAGTA
ncbi:MAG TPA: sulfotransferase [Acetobacteraceae bacterium]|nr:sulfotransferase [Acetobacteraceae bacterium]